MDDTDIHCSERLMLEHMMAAADTPKATDNTTDESPKRKGFRRHLAGIPGLSKFSEVKPTVSLLRLSGVIGSGGGVMRQGLSLSALASTIEKAFAPSDLSAVAVVINSPGGSPTQSALIHDRLRALSEEKKVPVYTFAEDVAASGGYWLLAAGDEAYATPTSIVGSIGVISASFGFQDAISRIGVERRVHTAGTKKGLLDPFLSEKPADVKRLKAIQAALHETFKNHVRTRRDGKLGGPDRDVGFDDETLFTGEFWLGDEALKLGLIDGIGDARAILREKFGDKVRIRPIQQRKGFSLGPFKIDSRVIGGGETPNTLGGLDLSTLDSAALVDGAATAIEERALWSRYGL
ncbi:MAG: S49 family peptidase [Pseudomonadota bacterium]